MKSGLFKTSRREEMVGEPCGHNPATAAGSPTCPASGLIALYFGPETYLRALLKYAISTRLLKNVLCLLGAPSAIVCSSLPAPILDESH